MNTERKSLIAKAQIEYYQLRNDDKDFSEQWGNSDKDFKEWLKEIYIPTIEKPIIKLENKDKNVFRIVEAISKALMESGLNELKEDFVKRATSNDYKDLLKLASEYIDIG